MRRLSDQETERLARLSGNVIKLDETLDINIDSEGWARLTYRVELLNLDSKPLTRVSRELWFEHAESPLVITPTPDSDRRMVIQRVHDTANLAKFAYQLSPPLQPGESALVGYSCDGGRFVDNHYWRETMHRHTRHFTICVRHQGVQLTSCTATEEHPDGSENSATDGLMWDYNGDDAIITLTRDYLRPTQTVTLRWEVIRGPA